jgi:hypothetical protein
MCKKDVATHLEAPGILRATFINKLSEAQRHFLLTRNIERWLENQNEKLKQEVRLTPFPIFHIIFGAAQKERIKSCGWR